MNNMAKNWKSILFYILIPVLLIGAVWYLSSNQSGTEVQYSQVVQMFEENQVKDFSLDLSSGALTYKTFKDPEKEQRYTVPNVSLFLDDVKDNVDAYNAKQTNNKNRITYNYKKGASGNWFTSMLPSLIMLIAIVGLGFYAFRRMNNAMMNDTNKTLGFGKIRTKTLVEDEKRKTTFQDVAGCDEEKGELEEIVEFLKNPDSFTALGARIPRGVLLVGPPGTGKTLLARAVAGEAGAPFLSISGSDFVEMYVGVGASRVRDLFEQAKKKGAIALFGEKYGNIVRVVKAGDFSTEFCGGTHVSNSGQIGLFHIVSEASVASGVRRITALTGSNVLAHIYQADGMLSGAAAMLRSAVHDLPEKLAALADSDKAKDKEIKSLKEELAHLKSADLFAAPVDLDGLAFYTATLTDVAPDALRSMGDELKNKGDNVVAVVAGVNGEKANIVAVCGKEAIGRGVKAGDVVREIAKLAGGGGGGRPDSAMAGCKNVDKLPDAMAQAAALVRDMIQ